MAISPRDWQLEEDQIKSAFARATIRYNQQKNDVQRRSGVTGISDVQDWATQGKGAVNFNIDAGNSYGDYQMMRQRQGQDIQGVSSDAYARGIGGSGVAQELARRARFQHTGELENWKSNLFTNISTLGQGWLEDQGQQDDALKMLTSDRTRWELENKLYEDPTPEQAAAGPTGSTTGNAAVIPAGGVRPDQMRDMFQVTRQIRLAAQKGDKAALAAIFKDPRVPEKLRKQADAELHRLRGNPTNGPGRTTFGASYAQLRRR